MVIIEIFLSQYNISNSNGALWRIGGIFQRDRELIYSLKPNEEQRWKTAEFFEHSKINSFGLRDREILESSLYDKRIIIIGNSMTFGHGVNNEQAFPNQLEQIFKEDDRNIDIINAGIKGYGTDQAYKFFINRLRSLNPDLVIFSIYTNDLYDNISLPLYTIEHDNLIPLDPTRNWLYFLGSLESITPQIIKATNFYKYVVSKCENRDLFFMLPRIDYKSLKTWSHEKIL